MKSPLSKLLILLNHPAMPLDAALRISWFVILWTLLFLVLADGLIFYKYGLGRAFPQTTNDERVVIKIKEKLIGDASEIIKNKRADFEAAKPVPADFPNPFR